MMTQLTETHNQKNSLFNAMNRFIGAVNNMDQTVMVPSLLRDVPLDEDSEMMSAMRSDDDEGDMYSYYQLLKSIRRDMEWGVRCAAADERRKENMTLARMNSTASTSSSSSSSSSSSASSSSSFDEDDEEYGDLEKLFKYHLTGLQDVLSKLTQQAISLTKRYKQEIGIGGWGQ